jgi:hypothetical protein
MPVRCVEVKFTGGALSCCNLDWQTKVSITSEEEVESILSMGQVIAFNSGDELHLPGGWAICCRIQEDNAQ